MKSTDLRAKARAIFGSAIAEPMPNQPNGAKALQQRANARPIPTYKVGGVVKKNDGGLLKKPVRGSSVTIPLEEERVKKLKKPANAPKMVDFEPRQPKTGKAPANAPKPPAMTRGPEADDVLITTRRGQQMLEAQKRREMEMEAERRKKQAAADKMLGIRMKNGGKMPDLTGDGKVTRADVLKGRGVEGFQKGGKVQTSADTAKKLATEMGGMKKGGKAKDGLAVMIAIGKVKKPVKKAAGGTGRANMRSEPAAKNARGPRYAHPPIAMAPPSMSKAYKEGGAPVKKAVGGATPSLTSTGNYTGAPAPVTRAKAPPVVKSSKPAGPKFGMYMDSTPSAPAPRGRATEPVRRAVGGAGKTRKGMAPIKKAQGGAAKVRKGMMSETGDIKQVVKPKKGLGGM